ncbi:acyltransferase [Spirillospora sp. NPDC047279]|uniref:acyltransferase family protein n=1 Tax=Spirillospora sp. NPDC047279 TaxID=3155478 RepID=UPI0033FC9F3F
MTKTGHHCPPVPVSASSRPPDGGTRTGAPGTVRLGWLDALRGLAALTVAFHHGTARFTPAFHNDMLAWFDPGFAGVLVFFLVSGYIIPASLERTGSLRRFWISRAFRIYPLLLVALGATLLLNPVVTTLAPGRWDAFDPATLIVSHLTMLQDLLAVPSAIGPLWTLSYEMVFYFLATAFFAVGLHRRSAAISLSFALTAVVLGGVLPSAAALASFGLPVDKVVLATGVTFVLAIGLACAPHPGLRRAGTMLGATVGLGLLLFNARVPAWEGLIILAVMFLGTAIYRAEQRQAGRRFVAITIGVVFTSACGLGVVHLSAWGSWTTDWAVRRAWLTAVIVTAVAFAIGYALRRRTMPASFVWLGTISYSVYLLHPMLLLILKTIIAPTGTDQWVLMTVFTALLLPVCHLTQRWVEAPAQRLGRRLARRADSPSAGPGLAAAAPGPELAMAGTSERS